MDGFDLDLGTIEREIDVGEDRRVVLGVLDGETPDEAWVEEVDAGNVLVLDIDGDVAELVAGFGAEVKEAGGALVHFRGFLIVAPPDVAVDTDRL